MFKFKSHKRKRTNASAIALGLCLSVLSFLLLSFALSFILAMFRDPLSLIGMFSVAALLLSGAISGFVTAKYKGEGAILPVSVSSLCFALALLGIGLILTRGILPIISLINLFAYLVLTVGFAFIAIRSKRRRR